MESKENKTTP
jgi:cell division cycle 20-like protein 1 (cofactor of APC complex)